MAHREASPTPPEFIVNPEGVSRATVVAAQKLVEAEGADRSAASTQPSAIGNIERAHYMDSAAHLRREADLIATTLEMILPRPDDVTWEEVIQAKVTE